MTRDPLNDADFLAWLRVQPPAREYDYDEPAGCPVWHYLEEAGCGPRRVDVDLWLDDSHNRQPLPAGWDDVVRAEPHTFGAAAERLAARTSLSPGRRSSPPPVLDAARVGPLTVRRVDRGVVVELGGYVVFSVSDEVPL